MLLTKMYAEPGFDEEDAEFFSKAEKEAFANFDMELFEDTYEDDPLYESINEEFVRCEEAMYTAEPTKYFDILERNEYILSIQRTTIEEIGEEFLDSDDLKEYGIEQNMSGLYLNVDAIKLKLQKIAATIPEGKVSVEIDDANLLDVLKEGFPPKFFGVTGYTRRGNRLVKNKNKKEIVEIRTAPNKEDFDDLFYIATLVSGIKYGLTFVYDPYSDVDVSVAITTIKKLVSWKEMEAKLKQKDVDKEKRKWIKHLWSNPQLANDIGLAY